MDDGEERCDTREDNQSEGRAAWHIDVAGETCSKSNRIKATTERQFRIELNLCPANMAYSHRANHPSVRKSFRQAASAVQSNATQGSNPKVRCNDWFAALFCNHCCCCGTLLSRDSEADPPFSLRHPIVDNQRGVGQVGFCAL